MDPLSETTGDLIMAQEKASNYGMSFSNQVNMTNCYRHCKRFFNGCEWVDPYPGESIHFNALIAYWMMAGYLGPFDSIEEAYERGHKILLDLTYGNDSMLKTLDLNPERIEFKTSAASESLVCSGHKGLCDFETLDFWDLVDLDGLDDIIVLADGMLKSVPKVTEDQSLVPNIGYTPKKHTQSMLLIHGSNLSRQVFHTPRKLRFLAYFNPRPESLNQLLNSVTKRLSVLLLRDCDLLREIDIPLEKFSKLTVLEISGLSQVQNFGSLLQDISKLSHLKCLNLSGLLIDKLPEDFFEKLKELRWVILRGCSRLIELPSVRKLTYLIILDVSYCSALKKSATGVLRNQYLQMLDFSYTSMISLPTTENSNTLTHVIARGVKASVFSCLRNVNKIKMLDLSGAKKVIAIKQLQRNRDLTVLNLSRTQISSIDFLLKFVHLRELVLCQCTMLEKLPSVGNLTKLEVFDISGCKTLAELPEGLSELESLMDLNLSLTSIRNLPSFAKLINLIKLSLRGLNLEEQELKFDFLGNLEKLEILDLSHTLVARLPDISKLVHLKELLLANCPLLEVVPNLHSLANLETLDLSLPDSCTISNGKGDIDIEVPTTLQKLVLKNRSGVKQVFPLTSHGELGYLDLRGTDVDRVPYENMARVSCILLPANVGLNGAHLITMGGKNPPCAIDWKCENPGHLQGKFSDASEIQIVSGNGNKASISTQGSQFFHLFEGANNIEGKSIDPWEAFIHQITVSHNGGIIYLDGDDFSLRGDRSWATRLLNLDLKGRSIEIHGFSELPDKILKVLDLADNVALVGNAFQVSICSKAMKVCCIRSCQEMESVLTENKKNGVVAGSLESLVLSNLVKLKMICGKNVSSKTIASLKHLYIDCCPELKNVITASQVLENLESLHVKFCDKMNSLFEFEQTISLHHLHKLVLFELPELESIEAKLPKLESLIIGQCPKLKSLDGVIESACASLLRLHLDSLPCLLHALPLSPELEKLIELKISSCNGIVTLFASSASSPASKIQSLQTLKLRNLPKLHNVGAELSLASAPDLDPRLPANVRQQIKFPALP